MINSHSLELFRDHVLVTGQFCRHMQKVNKNLGPDRPPSDLPIEIKLEVQNVPHLCLQCDVTYLDTMPSFTDEV